MARSASVNRRSTSAKRRSISVLTSAKRRSRVRAGLGEPAVEVRAGLGEPAVDLSEAAVDIGPDLGEASVETTIEEAEHGQQYPERSQLERHQAGDGAPEYGWIDSHHARNPEQECVPAIHPAAGRARR